MATDTPDVIHECVVCGGTAAADTTAACNWCDGRYHLNQRNDVEGQDCGRVWIDEQFLALQFACDRCLHAGAPPTRTTRAAVTSRPRRYKRRA